MTITFAKLEPSSSTLPKHGHKDAENEDARAIGETRFAIADGATESFCSGAWARLLANGYVAATDLHPWSLDWVRACVREWGKLAEGMSLSWYAEAKRERGAHSTLLGLSITDFAESFEAGTWYAVAVGDSCLFHLRNDQLIGTFPFDEAEDLGNRPDLVATESKLREAVIRTRAGECRIGDQFLLMTDAPSSWALRRKTSEELLIPARIVGESEVFAEWVEQEREAGHLHNDDVTIVSVRVTPRDEAPEDS